MQERKGENKGCHLKSFFISPLSLLYFSFINFFFLYTSFIFDRGHVTDLLRYVFYFILDF